MHGHLLCPSSTGEQDLASVLDKASIRVQPQLRCVAYLYLTSNVVSTSVALATIHIPVAQTSGGAS